METDFFGIITLFAIFHSMGIGAFLMFQIKKRGISAFFLGSVQISGAMVLISSLLTTTNLFTLFPPLIGVPYPFIFLSGFFSFFYISSLTEEAALTIKRMGWLILGPMIGLGLSLPHFFMSRTEQLNYIFYIQQNHNYPGYDWILWLIGLAYNWIVLAAALLRIRRYRQGLMKECSNTEGIDLSLLNKEIWLLFICWIVITLLSALSYNRWIVDFTIKMSALFPALYMIIIGYSYLLNLVPSVPIKPETNPLSGKLPEEQLTEMFVVIQQEMKQNKHYLDPELTLPILAEKTSFYRNELSEIINSQSGNSFYHFVNSYRIEHFKELLLQDRDKNILSLAFESGFNSKGAFYNAFKRVTGITPREFLTTEAV